MKKSLSALSTWALSSFVIFGAAAGQPIQSLPYSMPKTSFCNVRLALEDFREDFGSLRPLGDGYLGWGHLTGLWVDPSRDLVITVQVKKANKLAPAQATVKFYSLCTGKLLATGRQMGDASVQADDPLRVVMKMQNGRSLTVNLSLDRVHNQVNREALKVQVITPVGSNPMILDEFKVSRF